MHAAIFDVDPVLVDFSAFLSTNEVLVSRRVRGELELAAAALLQGE